MKTLSSVLITAGILAAPLPAAGDGGPGRPRALGRLRAAYALAEAPER